MLSELNIGEEARVQSVAGERGFRRRLLELGFVPGTMVKLIGRAPLGDPLEFEIRHCRISIRRAEAAGVSVQAP